MPNETGSNSWTLQRNQDLQYSEFFKFMMEKKRAKPRSTQNHIVMTKNH